MTNTTKTLRTDMADLFQKWAAATPHFQDTTTHNGQLEVNRGFVLSLVQEATAENFADIVEAADSAYYALTPSQRLEALVKMDVTMLTPESLLAYVAAVQEAAGHAALVRWSRATGMGDDLYYFLEGHPETYPKWGRACRPVAASA